MKKIKEMASFALSALVMFLCGVVGGGYASAADLMDGPVVQDLGGEKGHVVGGESSVTKNEQIQDAEWYVKQINKSIVEMKFTGTPIDQILRQANVNKSDSIWVKYYSVGQRPLRATLKNQFNAMTSESPQAIDLEDSHVVGAMDTLLCMDEKGEFIEGYLSDGISTDPLHPLMLRVHAIDSATMKPLVYAVNGLASASGNNRLAPALPAGTIFLRMGRAAAEKDVKTGRYYQLPSPDIQYCQRFIMQVEQTIYDRLSKNEVDWSFTRVERMAMEDMRIGMEATGLFGIKSKHAIDDWGNIYTSEGIWYRAGKDIELGHWEIVYDKSGNAVVENGFKKQKYVITEEELVDLVARIIDGAGNGSRTKLVFVDNEMYKALCNIKCTNRVRIFEPEKNYRNWGLDFQSFESMGTKLLFYRHDLFNAWGFAGRGFCLDPEYLDKWVFSNWERQEYNLKDLLLSNGNAVVMQEFSCWTLGYPDAHARLGMQEYVPIAG